MQVNNTQSVLPPTTPAPPDSSKTGPGTALNESSFMTLLSAELQNQDPTNPMEPTQFVGQLIQLNQLEATLQIQSSVGHLAAPPASVTSTTAS